MKTRFALLPGQLPHFRVLGGRFRPKPVNSATLAQQVKKINNTKEPTNRKKKFHWNSVNWFRTKTRLALLPGQLPQFRVFRRAASPETLKQDNSGPPSRNLTITKERTNRKKIHWNSVTDFGWKLDSRFFPGSSPLPRRGRDVSPETLKQRIAWSAREWRRRETSFGEASIPNKFVVLRYDDLFAERRFVWSRQSTAGKICRTILFENKTAGVFCVCFLFLRERSLAEGAREQRDLYISLSPSTEVWRRIFKKNCFGARERN